VYNLLGAKAANDFTNSWGIGIGMSQISDGRGVIIAALHAVLLMAILELLWLIPNGDWLSNYADFGSVYASVTLRRGCSRVTATASAYKRHFFAVS